MISRFYVARTEDFDCGIMISASHNPYYDNGIKLINGNGEKMDEATINLVEAYLDSELEVFGRKYEEIPFAHKNAIGCTVDYAAGRNRYMGYLISLGLYSFKGMKVGLDCANGSSWNMAQQIFDSLGAKTFVINAEPDGTNNRELLIDRREKSKSLAWSSVVLAFENSKINVFS